MWRPQPIDTVYRLKWPFMYAKSNPTLRDVELNSINTNHYFEKNFYHTGQDILPEVTVTFVGDFMGVGAKEIILGDKLKDRFQTSDKIIFNMESVIADSTKLQLFKQHTSMNSFTQFLKSYGSEKFIFGLANNHIDDFGNTGIQNTIEQIEKNNSHFFGLENCPKYNLADGLDIWGQTQWMSGKKTSANTSLYTQNIDSQNQFIEFIHWGNEFTSRPMRSQNEYFNSSSSLLTIGHHAHTPQKIIATSNRLCAFGLGNFTASVDSKRINFGQVLSVRMQRLEQNWKPVFAQWKFININVKENTVFVEEI